jgi:hypothetical protein
MGLNNSSMIEGANSIVALFNIMKLHSGPAGVNGTANLTTAAPKTPTWTTPTGLGNFSLAAQVSFTGGAPSGPVYSVTLWSTDGTFRGEFPMAATADPAFNGLGQYNVNAGDFTGVAS